MGQSTRLLLNQARDWAAGQFYHASKKLNRVGDWLKPETGITHFDDGALLGIFRRRPKSGTIVTDRAVRMGPNCVHAFITHPDGTVDDLGVSFNLLTNIGCMVLIGSVGADNPAGNTLASNVSTGISSTSVTGTGSVWTASSLGTPTLGCAGWRVYMNAHTTTNPVVWGNVISNTTNVLTIDQWWKMSAAAAGPPIQGTTPTSGDAFVIGWGGVASVSFMALTTDSGAASATHTALTSEQNGNGCARSYATFARGSNPSGGSGTFTLQKAYSISGTITALHRMGLFCDGTAASAGPLIFESVLNADATVANGDTLTCLRGDTKIKTRSGIYALKDLVGQEIEVLNKQHVWEKGTVKSFGTQRLHRINFAHMSPVYATADHRWWQQDGTRVTTKELKRVPFTEDISYSAEVTSVENTGIDEEVFCAVVPGSESFTLANGLVTSNCTDTVTLAG